jgi:formamidopyrimidine-DNA glycosylase
MPELPDVEVYRRRFEAHGLNKTVAKAQVREPGDMVEGLSGKKLAERLEGHRFTRTRRHGKHLLAHLGQDGWLTLHFGMTGDLVPFDPDADEEPRYTKLRLDFEGGGTDGALAYVNKRKLGRIGHVEDAEAFVAGQDLGPDALEVSESDFLGRLSAKRGNVKGALMDQTLVAGIGNVYADEILFHAHVHPETALPALDRPAREKLFHALRKVLKTAIDCGAGSETLLERLPEDFLLAHREAGAHCPVCGGAIEKISAGGRSGYACPHCQPKPG